MFGSDDDADFLAANSSKLASLFSGAQAVDDTNATFTYAAPRQPKKGILKEEKPSTSNSESLPSSSSAANVQSTNKLSIIIVKAVHTFLLEDGKYNPQGKLGAALLGNAALHIYQLLLYKGKQQHVTCTPISADFQFTVQPNNYSTFYTDKGQNWSLHFESNADGVEFAREIGLARANSVGGCDDVQSLVTQVLSVPLESIESLANVGDTVDIFYTAKTYSAGKLGHLVESNCDAKKPQRVKIREHVWEEGLIGASKDSKRMIMLPPTMLGPWKPAVPEGTSLVVEVEPIRLKQAKLSIVGSSITLPTMLDSTESALDSSTDEQSIKARGASISEALTNSPKTHKASIISRMARMGQATLPLKGAIAFNPSDSEETGDEASVKSFLATPYKTSKNRSAKPRTVSSQQPSQSAESVTSSIHADKNVVAPQPMALYQTVPSTWQQQQQAYAVMGQFPMSQFQSGDGKFYGHLQTVGSHQMVPSTSAPVIAHQVYSSPSVSAVNSPTSDISVFLSETRMHNTEVRMAVTKVADKVDQLIGKYDAGQPCRPNYSGALLDSSTLLASVQKIVGDNELLQSELAEKRAKLESQNDTIYKLLNANHNYLEKNNSSSADLVATISELKEEKSKLVAELAEANAKVLESQHKEDSKAANVASLMKQQQTELRERQSYLTEQETILAQLSAQLEEATDANKRHENTILQLRESMCEIQAGKDRLGEGLRELTHQLDYQKREAEEQANTITAQYTSQIEQLKAQGTVLQSRYDAVQGASELTDSSVIVAEVKRVMNAVWKTLNAKFVSGSSYDGTAIRETLMSTIRDVTIQFVEMKSDAGLSRHEQNRVDVMPKIVSDVHLKNIHDRAAMEKPASLSRTKNQEPSRDSVIHDSAVSKVRVTSESSAKEPSRPKIVDDNVVKQQAVQLPSHSVDAKPSAQTEDIEGWRPQPPPPPLFDDDEDDDDWLA